METTNFKRMIDSSVSSITDYLLKTKDFGDDIKARNDFQNAFREGFEFGLISGIGIDSELVSNTVMSIGETLKATYPDNFKALEDMMNDMSQKSHIIH